jgi:cyanophycin synthetase
MLQEALTDMVRINARKEDAFDIFNLKFYIGPNPYLNEAAAVFDFALTGYLNPKALEEYHAAIGEYYPHLQAETFETFAELFARTVSEVNKLNIDLHLDRWSLQETDDYFTVAIQTLHTRTTRSVIYCVWDWFEAITQDETFDFATQLIVLQNMFRRSAYGGPTVYTLWRTAAEKGIPAFYLWDEGLVQYGYGKKQVRGIATTFECDSHLDSDFTTRKDDCKAFLDTLGFPVPKGDIVRSTQGAMDAAQKIGYPVAVKPVVGHKGIGVTADVQDSEELIAAFDRAVDAIAEDQPVEVIVEKSVAGADYRLLCVNGRFVAATERRPAWVTGDGYSTIMELIDRENSLPARQDSPTSPLSKIQSDEAMDMFLEEQRLSLDTILEKDRTVYLRKVANLSAGGVSLDATSRIHQDNIILAQDIAQYFRLTCLGIDVIAQDISKSWKDSNFGIIEINSAPGISMHLRPAVGESVDVPTAILETFFQNSTDARIPIITFNDISRQQLHELIDHILWLHPDWIIGAVCREAVLINRSEKVLNPDYNTNVQTLLRHPKLDLLITEYSEEIFSRQGMFYQGSDLVVLNNPTPTEMMLAHDLADHATLVINNRDNISIRRNGLLEQYTLENSEPLSRVYLKEVGTILKS